MAATPDQLLDRLDKLIKALQGQASSRSESRTPAGAAGGELTSLTNDLLRLKNQEAEIDSASLASHKEKLSTLEKEIANTDKLTKRQRTAAENNIKSAKQYLAELDKQNKKLQERESKQKQSNRSRTH